MHALSRHRTASRAKTSLLAAPGATQPRAPGSSCTARALTPSNCSRSPRRWSRPCRSRRSSPRKGASSWGRRRGPQPRTPSGARRPARPPPSLLPAGPRRARLPRRRARLLTALSHAATLLRRKSRRGPRLPRGRGPRTLPLRAPPPRSPAWPAIGWGGRRGRARPRPPAGRGSGVGTRRRTWGPGAARRGCGGRERELAGVRRASAQTRALPGGLALKVFRAGFKE